MSSGTLWRKPRDIDRDIYDLLRERKFSVLLDKEKERISEVVQACLRWYDMELRPDEVQHYANVGYFYSCRYWKEGMNFEILSTFWMRMYIFQQVYVETYLTRLDVRDRSTIAKLYNKVLKNMDIESGKNYFDAIYTAAAEANVLTDSAVELMYMLVKQTLEAGGTDESLETALMPMYLWDGDMNTVPIAPLMLSLEAMAVNKTGEDVNLPFMHIAEKFENLVT